MDLFLREHMWRTVLLCLLLPIATSVAYAQSEPDSSVGAQRRQSGGMGVAPLISWYGGMPLQSSAVHGVDHIDASGLGYAIGASGMFWMGTTWGLNTAVMYMKQNVSAHRDITMPTQIWIDPNDPSTPPVIVAPVRLESSASFDLLRVSAAYLQEFASVGDMRIGIYTGPGFAYVLGVNRQESVTLDPALPGRFFNPDGLPVENDARTLILYYGPPPDQLSTRVSILGGLRVELPISASFLLHSSIEYDYELSPEAKGFAGPTSSLMINLGIERIGAE